MAELLDPWVVQLHWHCICASSSHSVPGRSGKHAIPVRSTLAPTITACVTCLFATQTVFSLKEDMHYARNMHVLWWVKIDGHIVPLHVQ